MYYITIHKKTFCLSQKYPKHWYICGDKEFFTESKYGGGTSVKAAASKWWSFFNFFKNFTYNFFVYFQLHSSMSQIYANHATSPSMFFCDVTRNFCCCETNERPLAKHKFIEIEIGFHLDDVGWISKVSPYSNLEKGIGLCKHLQVSGYFCLKQKSFFWIVLRRWTLTGL